jgi:hypothetical protein
MFELTKWYVDVVDPAGRLATAYWAQLRWGSASVRWESLSLYRPGVEPVHRAGIGSSTGPRWLRCPVGPGDSGVIGWRSRALACDIECRPWTGRFASRLLDADGESLDWGCEAPAASVTVKPHGLAGDGYAERLVLRLPPWKLPISELRWGRWSCASTRRSVVWIDWRGGHPLTLVLVDGAPAPCARVEDDRIVVGDSELSLGHGRTLHARTLGDILDGLGPIAARLPTSWQEVEDRKTLSIGTLRGCAGDTGGDVCGDTGWAIHETVRFP